MKPQLLAIVDGFLLGVKTVTSDYRKALTMIAVTIIVWQAIRGVDAGLLAYLFGWVQKLDKEMVKVMKEAGYQIITLVAVVLALKNRKP